MVTVVSLIHWEAAHQRSVLEVAEDGAVQWTDAMSVRLPTLGI